LLRVGPHMRMLLEVSSLLPLFTLVPVRGFDRKFIVGDWRS